MVFSGVTANPLGICRPYFKRISDLGLKVILATNNATRNVEEYLEKLSGYGVTLEAMAESSPAPSPVGSI